jgi:hypothetical protein
MMVMAGDVTESKDLTNASMKAIHFQKIIDGETKVAILICA